MNMDKIISYQTIEDIISTFDGYSDPAIEKEFENFFQHQPALNVYIDSTAEIFEDEENYFDLLAYYSLVIDKAYSKTFGKRIIVPIGILESTEKRDTEFFESVEDEMFEDELLKYVESHPQKEVLNFLFDEIFLDDEDDTDDETDSYNVQLFLLLLTINNAYHFTSIND